MSQNATLKAAGLSKGVRNSDELDRLTNDPEAPVHRSVFKKGNGQEFRYRYVAVEGTEDALDF